MGEIADDHINRLMGFGHGPYLNARPRPRPGFTVTADDFDVVPDEAVPACRLCDGSRWFYGDKDLGACPCTLPFSEDLKAHLALDSLIGRIDYEVNRNPAPFGDGAAGADALGDMLIEALPYLQLLARYAPLAMRLGAANPTGSNTEDLV